MADITEPVQTPSQPEQQQEPSLQDEPPEPLQDVQPEPAHPVKEDPPEPPQPLQDAPEPAQPLQDAQPKPPQPVKDDPLEPLQEEPAQAVEPPEPEPSQLDLDDEPGLADDVDVRAYEEDPDPNEEYDEDGGFVVKDAELEAVLETERVIHTAAEITVQNVLPEGQKRTRRQPQRYEPVETPVDDIDRPVKRRKVAYADDGSKEDEETDTEETEETDTDETADDDDEEYEDLEEESSESEDSEEDEADDDDEPLNIVD
jgi:hypothetical protein